MATPERAIIESMFMIPTKSGDDVPFVLNREQALLDSHLTGRDRVPKARQLGITSYVLARWTARCLYKRNTRAVVISHDTESTQRMLARVHYILENLRGPKAKTKLANKNEITFPKTDSMFYIGTAGAKKFGRGDMITNLHCSEIAYWPDPKALTTGLYQAVPIGTGEIIEESTGNGTGNYYHRRCMDSYAGTSQFRLHFFNWLNFPEYRISLTDEEKKDLKTNLNPAWEEIKLYEEGILNLEQIAWRRIKLEELDYDLKNFKQEYPITLDECFQSTGFGLFPVINYEPRESWKQIDSGLWVDTDELGRISQSKYALGVDVSAGVGRDRSVIHVLDIMRNRQVGEYVVDNVPPDLLAFKIKYIGEMFNDAFVTVESNNHGGMTLLELKKIYPMHLLYSSKEDTEVVLEFGYRTTSKTKPLLINNLRKEFTDGFKIVSPGLKDELSTFVETEEGKLQAQEGCFDDRVMAAAICQMGARKAFLKEILVSEQNRKVISTHNPFSLDSILHEFNRKSTRNFPIPPQHRLTQQ